MSNNRKLLLFAPQSDDSQLLYRSQQWQWDTSVSLEVDTDEQEEAAASDPESDAYNFMTQFKQPVMPEKLFKVIVIGDPTVGKTSYVQRYVQNSYSKEYKGTVGVDFALKILKWSDTQTVKLQLWDIAGQERFTWMTRVYFKDAHGCIIMFDLTNKHSFENTLKWKKDVDSKCTLPDGSPIPCMLLANKCDLSHRQVEQMAIETFYKENNFIGWTETSAKEGLMVNDSMKFLVEVMMKQDGSLMGKMENSKEENIVLMKPGAPERTKCSC